MGGIVICAICGKEIKDTPSIDHVFPRALYKWSECYLPKGEYKHIERLISGPDNRVKTHDSCNKAKEDEMPVIDRLHISEDQMGRLGALEGALMDLIDNYTINKSKVLTGQNRRCLGCGRKIKGEGVLRRIDPKKKRTWDNACIVCHVCNTNKSNFIGK